MSGGLPNWCVRMKGATPESGRSWSAKAATLVSGGTAGAASSYSVVADASGNLVVTVIDGGTNTKAFTAAHSYAAGSKHTASACSINGTLALYDTTLPGAPVTLAGSASGAGTGLLAVWPTAVYFGASSAAGSAFEGYIESLDWNSTGNPLDFAL